MGNAENLKGIREKTYFTKENAAEMGRRGRLAQAERARARKTIAEALRKVLDEPASKEAPDVSRLDAIVGSVVSDLYKHPNAQGLRIIADILGELEHKVKVDGPGVAILTQDEADAIAKNAK